MYEEESWGWGVVSILLGGSSADDQAEGSLSCQGRLLSSTSVWSVRRTLGHICWMTVDGAEWWACLSIGPAVDRAELLT